MEEKYPGTLFSASRGEMVFSTGIVENEACPEATVILLLKIPVWKPDFTLWLFCKAQFPFPPISQVILEL